MQRQAHDELLDAEQLEILVIQVNHAHEFLLELVFGAVDVGIVHLHRADAHQAEKLARFLVAVARAILGQADGQVAVGARLGAEDFVVHRAIHRLDVVAHALDLHGRVHGLGVVGQVAGVHEQVFFGEVRGADAEIACLFLHLLCQPFQFLDDDAAARQPERQAGADLVIVDEDFQFLAEFTVVASFGFFEHRQVLFEFLGRLPGRSVEARQHLVLLVAAPVGPSDGHQLDGSRVDLPRRLHVRAATQVRERVALIDRNLGLFGQRLPVLVEAAFFQALDQFQLIGLILENLARLFSRNHLLDEGVASGDDLAHTLFDLRQVFLNQRPRQVEIIVKAVFDWRADGVLGLWVEFQHRLRHDVRRRVADSIQLGIFVTFFGLVGHFLSFALSRPPIFFRKMGEAARSVGGG